MKAEMLGGIAPRTLHPAPRVPVPWAATEACALSVPHVTRGEPHHADLRPPAGQDSRGLSGRGTGERPSRCHTAHVADSDHNQVYLTPDSTDFPTSQLPCLGVTLPKEGQHLLMRPPLSLCSGVSGKKYTRRLNACGPGRRRSPCVAHSVPESENLS